MLYFLIGIFFDAAIWVYWRTMNLVFQAPADESEKPSKLPPLLLIHGSGGFPSQWNSFRKQLGNTFGNQMYSCYTIELPQEPVVSINVEMLHAVSEKVESILKLTGHPQVSLVGHSMGGLVAARFALKRPDVVAAVVTIGAPWKGVPVLHYCHRCCGSVHRLEMRPHSHFLQNLNAQWSVLHLQLPPLLCITGAFDVQVPPNNSGHDRGVVANTFSSHLSLLLNPSVVQTTGMFFARLTNTFVY
jgi:hypothetical protein